MSRGEISGSFNEDARLIQYRRIKMGYRYPGDRPLPSNLWEKYDFETDPPKHDDISLESMTRDVNCRPNFKGEYFAKLIQYPVVVEMWKHKSAGRGKRAYLKEFDEKERRIIGRYHSTFEKWHLVTGTPLRVSCSIKTILFLQRVVNFFATI
jgi:hypothetical protein